MKENLNEIDSKELKEMYEKNEEMKNFLDKEYTRIRGNNG
jgi:hypothetical protein